MNTTDDVGLFSSQYERGLLGLIYTHKDLLLQAKQRVSSDYFLYKPHRIIYTAMCLLSEQVELSTLDVDTLYIESSKLGLADSGVGPDYLMVVCHSDYSRSNFDLYLSKVGNAYRKFRLSETLKDLHKLVQDNHDDVGQSLDAKELADEVAASLSRLEAYEDEEKEAILVNERVEEYILERAENPTSIQGLTTGFPRFDEDLNGLTEGSLTIIAGMPGAGKSTVLLNMANHIAFNIDEPVPILFLSTEMYTDEDISRLVAMRSLLRERDIANGKAYHDPKKRQILDRVVNEIKTGSTFFHEYMPEFNSSKLANRINYYKFKYGIGLVVFDYIKLETSLDHNSQLKNRREDQVLGDITNTLKLAAGKLKIPILAACQVNSRTMRVADSDRIQRYCNNLIEFRPNTVKQMEHEGDVNKYGTHNFVILKARAGGGKRHPVRFWKPCNLVQEAETYFEESEEDGTLEHDSVLTTPLEFQDSVNEQFRVRRAEDVVSQVGIEEMEVVENVVQDDDPMF